MYRLNPDVVIRTCLDKAFYINIRTNVVIATNVGMKEDLEKELKKGLYKEELQNKPVFFRNIIFFLEDNTILEVIQNDVSGNQKMVCRPQTVFLCKF